MEYYYIVIKSWWEKFPDQKIRVRRRISFFRYVTYEGAREVAIELRKKDPHYRYDLGDRIYVRRCKNV